MIRPVTHQQMQRVGQPPLQSPRKPRVSALSLPASPLKASSMTFPKSPIKKHLRNASSFALEASSDGAAVASNEDFDRPSSSPLHGPLKAKLRASVLQAVLRLLDQDVGALAGAHEVLQAAAALPLTEPSVQRACVQALRALHGSSAVSLPPSFAYDSSPSSNSNWDANEPPIPSSPRKQTLKALQQARASGRPMAPAVGSLHHCKEFLLACANEIHELEDDHPAAFDYAEDTSSSSSLAQRSEAPPEPMCKHCGAANFDYASTVQESSDASGDSASYCGDEDDTRADQGSQFSEVLHRAEYMSDIEDGDEGSDAEVESTGHALSTQDRVVCRQVLRALHEHVQSKRQPQRQRSSAANLAVKFHAFEALKLQASLARKRLAFQRLKNGLRSRPQPASARGKTSSAAHVAFQTLLLRNADVLLLLLALVFLANVPAKHLM
jgi:uncharacterized membrane protein